MCDYISHKFVSLIQQGMIIPVRCFTCGKVIGNKWNYYKTKREEQEENNKTSPKQQESQGSSSADVKYFDNNKMGKVLDDLGLSRMCCRRMVMSHVDLIQNI